MEILQYVILGAVVGFVGEKYKNMSTIKYAFFIVFIFVLLYAWTFFEEGALSMPDIIELSIVAAGILIPTSIFHLQKKLRAVK